MTDPNKTYKIALKFENNGYFLPAYSLFKECLKENKYDPGDLLFHCAWCLEHIRISDKKRSAASYLLAAKTAKEPLCRMNAYFRAGWVLRHLNENSKAIKAFSKAIEVGHYEGLFNSIYHEALYWFAVSLETENRYLDAIELYRLVSSLSNRLKPESKYRELLCLISVGQYREAVDICSSFDQPQPEGFSPERYAEIRNLVNHEKSILESCFNQCLN